MTSNSALKAPAALSDCNIAMRSCGVAPNMFNALTTWSNDAPLGTDIRLSGFPSLLIVAVSAVVTVVLPRLNGSGWLVVGV